MAQLLQNIKKVEWIETRYLKDIVITPENKVLLSYWRNFQELPIVGLAQVSTAESIDNNSRLTTVSLTALSCSRLDVGDKHLAWRVTTVVGTEYLIGINEQPYPVTTISENYPDKATDQGGATVKVEWKTALGLLKIID